MIYEKYDGHIIEEMSIVDIFTKLIFDADTKLAEAEVYVVDLLRQIDQDLLEGSQRDISEHLRAMGVDEMITLVAQIKKKMDQQQNLVANEQSSQQLRLHR